MLDVTGHAFLAQQLSGADGRRLIAIFEEWLDSPPAVLAAKLPSNAIECHRMPRIATGWTPMAPLTNANDHHRWLRAVGMASGSF